MIKNKNHIHKYFLLNIYLNLNNYLNVIREYLKI